MVQVQFDQLIFIFRIAVRCLQSIDRRAQLYLLPPMQVVCGKVMFSVVSVCQSGRSGGGITMWQVTWNPPPSQDTWDPPFLKTCSNLFTWQSPSPDQFKLIYLRTLHHVPLTTFWRADGWPLTESPSCVDCYRTDP